MSDKGKLRIAGVVKESSVDGEGLRYVVFTQGCYHNCKGCHNQHTHDVNGGKLVEISKIIEDINKNPLLHGVTISGGEPMLQIDNLIPLLSKLKSMDKHIMVYTGYTYEQLIKLSECNDDFKNTYNLLEYIDILVDGKFEESLKSKFSLYRGSTNQRLIDVKKSLKRGCVQIWVEPKDLTEEMEDLDSFLGM